MLCRKNVTFLLFLILFVGNSLEAQDSTRKFTYFKNDSVLSKKFNLTLEFGFQRAKYKNYVYNSSVIPSNEEFDNYKLYKQSKISFNKSRAYNLSLNMNYRLREKFYISAGLKWQTINSSIEINSDSLYYKNDYELWEVKISSHGNLVYCPLFLQYRINKYFYPFVGYSINVLSSVRKTLYDSEVVQSTVPSRNINDFKLNEKVAGFDFNFPKAKRLYFTFKFVHTGKKWTLRDKDLWYSFGLKYYLI
jgi:hypothetical protein